MAPRERLAGSMDGGEGGNGNGTPHSIRTLGKIGIGSKKQRNTRSEAEGSSAWCKAGAGANHADVQIRTVPECTRVHPMAFAFHMLQDLALPCSSV